MNTKALLASTTKSAKPRLPEALHGILLCLLAVVWLGVSVTTARAVPSFAVQTGQPCNACHVGGFGPQLTPFGRDFKLHGYAARAVSLNLPVSAMALASYIHTVKDQSGPPAPGFGANDNLALDQFGLFLAGGLGSHLGAFVQATYDGVAKAYHWDNLDLRAVTTAKLKGVEVLLGLSLNNAPTVQDAFNTLPAWSFPYTSSSLAPHPAASPLIGNLAQNTMGLTTYLWINSEFYAEAGGYGSPSANFLTHAGIDPTAPGNIRGVAPYGRLAYLKNFGDRNLEIGAFAMTAALYPGRDESVGVSDHYDDLGLDASYQLFAKKKDVVAVNARYTYQHQRLGASQALGLSSNEHDVLQDFRVDASYYWRNVVGLTMGGFNTWGSSDALLYAGSRKSRPDSSGITVQIDGTPFGAGGSPLGPRFNMRVGVQYTAYFQFDGGGGNYDGLGASARDNNTLRVFTWLAY